MHVATEFITFIRIFLPYPSLEKKIVYKQVICQAKDMWSDKKTIWQDKKKKKTNKKNISFDFFCFTQHATIRTCWDLIVGRTVAV